MTPDRAKLNFFSGDPVDMVVQEGEVTIVNDGLTSSMTASKIVTGTAANAYGRAGLMRARWSVDGGANWNGLESKLVYTFTDTYNGMFGSFVSILPALKAAISIGSSDSLIHFRTANGYHGDSTSDDSTSLYTPISQTFLIQYALYERGV